MVKSRLPELPARVQIIELELHRQSLSRITLKLEPETGIFSLEDEKVAVMRGNMLLRRKLKALGCKLVLCDSFKEALLLVAYRKADSFITLSFVINEKINLPKLEGFEFTVSDAPLEPFRFYMYYHESIADQVEPIRVVLSKLVEQGIVQKVLQDAPRSD